MLKLVMILLAVLAFRSYLAYSSYRKDPAYAGVSKNKRIQAALNFGFTNFKSFTP